MNLDSNETPIPNGKVILLYLLLDPDVSDPLPFLRNIEGRSGDSSEYSSGR